MLLFRALNENNMFEYINGNDIGCNLDRSGEEVQHIRDEVYKKDISLIFDRMIAHVIGKNIKNSCWISASSDFNFVASEYAILQSGNFNKDDYRKNIALIIVDDSNMISENELKEQNKCHNYYIGKCVDISNGQLSEYVKKQYIKPLSANDKSYFYNVLYDINIGNKPANISGFSNFATAAKEYIFFSKIYNFNIATIITPLLQDIIFTKTNGKTLEETNRVIIECLNEFSTIDTDIFNYHKYDFTSEEINIINYLYNSNDGCKYNSLICALDYLYDGKSKNITMIYEYLKEVKRHILEKITKLNNIILLDDYIYAVDHAYCSKGILPNNRIITAKNNNDIVYHTDVNGKLIRGKVKMLK